AGCTLGADRISDRRADAALVLRGSPPRHLRDAHGRAPLSAPTAQLKRATRRESCTVADSLLDVPQRPAASRAARWPRRSARRPTRAPPEALAPGSVPSSSVRM